MAEGERIFWIDGSFGPGLENSVPLLRLLSAKKQAGHEVVGTAENFLKINPPYCFSR